MNILTQSTDTKMTSQQIAELVEKRHDSVKRTIDYLVKEGAIQLPHHVEVRNHIGQAVGNYVFSGEQGRLDSITVVAQLSPTFTAALVKRWDELERGVAPAIQIPQSFAEALQLAADQAKQLELAAPKIAHYDKVVERDTLLNATTVAQSVGIKSANALNKMLEVMRVYNMTCKRGRAFQAWFIDKGYGEMKQGDTGHHQALFTTSGQAWIIEKLGGVTSS